MLAVRLFHGAGASGATMDPVEGAGYRCREPRRREPYVVQEWILQKVQSASAECCRAECYAGSEKFRALFDLAYLEMQFIFLGADFVDFSKSNSITPVSESACSKFLKARI